MRITPFVTVAWLAGCSLAQAATVSAIAENFEGTLSAWTQKSTAQGAPQGIIVNDPLRPGNHVLSFSAIDTQGTLFSTDFITTSGQFTVAFEYLGRALPGSVAGNLGGFFGISRDYAGLSGRHDWFAGTIDNFTNLAGQSVIGLIDDGQWHHYSLTFASTVTNTVHLMFEDYNGSGGVAGDVFFDNVQFNASDVTPLPVPEPGSAPLLGLGAVALAGYVARRRRAG